MDEWWGGKRHPPLNMYVSVLLCLMMANHKYKKPIPTSDVCNVDVGVRNIEVCGVSVCNVEIWDVDFCNTGIISVREACVGLV
jgi:hypothetical protein